MAIQTERRHNQWWSSEIQSKVGSQGVYTKGGSDYHEIFSPVVKFKTIRMMLAIVAHYDLELEQLDVKTAFLHGDLDEKIYMK